MGEKTKQPEEERDTRTEKKLDQNIITENMKREAISRWDIEWNQGTSNTHILQKTNIFTTRSEN